MIPKIIHYCWFGKGQLPDSAQQFINGWRTLNPDYEIIQWNENNFPVADFPYSKEAYENRKFAFVSDVARLYALYEYGGIYLDTDVEVLKSFDDLLVNSFFMGYETDVLLGTAVIGSTKHNPIVGAMLKVYDGVHFLNGGVLDQTTNVERLTSFMVDNGYMISSDIVDEDEDVRLYTKDFFSPKSYSTGEICITDNTYTIHHFECSWYSFSDKVKAFVRKTLGPNLFYKLMSVKLRFK